MKRLFVIILILCTWVTYPMLHAQVFTTSSASYRSVSSGGMAVPPAPSVFRSTSSYAGRGYTQRTTPSISYSTAPMRVANGTIGTVASQLNGGQLTDAPSSSGNSSTQQGGAVIPGVPYFQPIGDGWDVALLLAIMCVIYALYLTYKSRKEEC